MECAFGRLKKKPFFAMELVSDPPFFALNYLAVVFLQYLGDKGEALAEN